VTYLLDTNVVSELTKVRPNPGVVAWRRTTSVDDHFVSVLVLGEIRRGVELLRPRDPGRAQSIDDWLTSLRSDFKRRILPVDAAVADAWGRLDVPDRLPAIDGLMAATALVHDLTLVTRNTADIRRPSVRMFNPFQS
jgi:toxin FitB